MVETVSSPFERGLQALTDAERRQRSAQMRLERADRSIVDGLSGTFLGTLQELLETAAPVTVLTRTEAAIRGTVKTLGPDVVVIRTDKSGDDAIVRVTAIEGLLESSAGHNRTVSGLIDGPSFSELLDSYSETNERIAITMSSNNNVMGTIQRVGQDQLVLQLDGRGDTMTIPIAAIDQIVRAR